MPETTKRPATNQELQKQLVEQATKIPGVAEALEAYGAAERFAAYAPTPAAPAVRHATGGNQQ